MADAYGVIIVGKSVDFEGDLVGICTALNEIGMSGAWSKDDVQFVLNGEDLLFADRVQYPTVYPEEIAGYALIENGERKDYRSIEEITDDDYEIEENWDLETRVVPLKVICESVSEHLIQGSVKVTASANEKTRYVYLEELTIFADGSGERTRKLIATRAEDESDLERYDPKQES